MNDGTNEVDPNVPPSANAQTRARQLKKWYTIAGALAPFVDLSSYPLVHSWLKLVIYAIFQYSLLFLSYFFWKRVILKNKLSGIERSRHISFMVLFAVIFFFVDIFSMYAIVHYIPAILALPTIVKTLLVVIPGVTVGVLVGDFFYRHYNYDMFNWLN